MTRYPRRWIEQREQIRRWIDPRLPSVRAADIETYLLKRGWKPVPSDMPNFLVFQEPTAPEDGPLYQWVPTFEGACEYTNALHELIADLAVIENRYAVEVLDDILREGAAAGAVNGAGQDQADAVGKS